MSSEVVVVLPWVPATATTGGPASPTPARPSAAAGAARARGLDDLGVVLADGGGDHHGVGVVHVLGGVPDVAAGAERAQRLEGAGLLGVAAADR